MLLNILTRLEVKYFYQVARFLLVFDNPVDSII